MILIYYNLFEYILVQFIKRTNLKCSYNDFQQKLNQSLMKNQQTQEVNCTNTKTRSRTKPIPTLCLKVQTWEKQSHGLFDYNSEADKIYKEQFQIKHPSSIFRNHVARRTLVKQRNQNDSTAADRLEIFKINYDPKQKYYVIKNTQLTKLESLLNIQPVQNQAQCENNRLFHSLLPTATGHQLKIGDFVKLGRVQLVVLQINNTQTTSTLDYQQVYGTKQFIFHLKEELQGSCKVCLNQQATQKDPLVNPCQCKGSCGVIHLECLRNWINNKVRKEIYGKVKTYNFDKFFCEICNAPFPSMIRLENGDEVEMLNFERPTSPYLLMEQLSQTQQKTARILHFVLPQEGAVASIGRAQTCDLLISDISVSRNHSQIMFRDKKFYIRDLKSKFGTLVEVKDDILVKSKLRLQHNGCCLNIDFQTDKKTRASKSGRKGQVQFAQDAITRKS